ncbi:hypothetical protein [Vibrio alfacsensis]|uniref:hypothetical protein n=1 Tax=Vibrio alfacsensis TaxID=1074311 RepID=UPI001BEE7FAC|nr:hypothetical protein [Vibrio alfacsensis]BCN24559.1 hypothetical protein VYA_17510 [Vibrio alfacsensis]
MKKTTLALVVTATLSGCAASPEEVQCQNRTTLYTDSYIWKDGTSFTHSTYDCQTKYVTHSEFQVNEGEGKIELPNNLKAFIVAQASYKDYCGDDPVNVRFEAVDESGDVLASYYHFPNYCNEPKFYENEFDRLINEAVKEEQYKQCELFAKAMRDAKPTDLAYGYKRMLEVNCSNKTAATQFVIDHPKVNDIDSNEFLQKRATLLLLENETVSGNCLKMKEWGAVEQMKNVGITRYGSEVLNKHHRVILSNYVDLETCK